MNTITNYQSEFDFNDDQFVSLTAMYRRVVDEGKSEGLENPYDWSRNAGKRLILKVAERLNTGKALIIKTKRGKGGGTWAHWMIASAYAQYLDPDLAIHFTEVVRALQLGDPRVVDVLLKNASAEDKHIIFAKVSRRMFTDRLQAVGVRDGMTYGRCTNIVYKNILGGKKDQLLARRGLAKTSSLRENLSLTELLKVALAESMAADVLEAKPVQSEAELLLIVEQTSIKVGGVSQ